MTPSSALPSSATQVLGTPRRSRLAVLSLITGVLPIASILAPVLGALALRQIRRDPGLEGRLLAWTGIVIGTVVTAAVFGSAYSLQRMFSTLAERPGVALRAAMAGDVAAFREQMTGPGAQATTQQVTDWAHSLEAQFGALQNVTMATTAPKNAPQAAPTGDRINTAYVVTFARATVPAQVLFAVPPGTAMGLLQARIRRITLEPADGARIVFPDAEPDGAATPSAPAASGPGHTP